MATCALTSPKRSRYDSCSRVAARATGRLGHAKRVNLAAVARVDSAGMPSTRFGSGRTVGRRRRPRIVRSVRRKWACSRVERSSAPLKPWPTARFRRPYRCPARGNRRRGRGPDSRTIAGGDSTLLARKLDGRRSTRRLPAQLDDVLTQPIASAGMTAEELWITLRAARIWSLTCARQPEGDAIRTGALHRVAWTNCL